MRVAYVCADRGVPIFGSKGCSIHVQGIVRALIKGGADLDLIASRIEGVSVSGIESAVLYKLRTPGLLGNRSGWDKIQGMNEELHDLLHRKGPFDMVYERYSLWSFSAMEYARSSGIPGVLEVNAPLIDEQARYRGLTDSMSAEKVSHRVFSAASLLVAVSNEVEKYLKRFPGTEHKTEVLYNGVDPERFVTDVQPRFQKPDGSFTVGFVGTLKKWHGLPMLAEAFSRMSRLHSGSRLLVVGDGPERQPLEKMLTESIPQGSVEFTGAVASSAIPSFLASMDVGVAPYPEHDFYFSPLKVFEYMAAGLPVIASRVGQLRDIIRSGWNGMLVPPDNAGLLTEALITMLKSPDERRRMGRNARKTVLGRYTWDRIVSSILNRIHNGAGLSSTVRNI